MNPSELTFFQVYIGLYLFILTIQACKHQRDKEHEILILKVLDISGRPSGLENFIDHQEMADLLAFILKIK